MTSILLQPTTVESCGNSLRTRRHSSIRPLDLLPRFFSDERPADVGECAVADDDPATDSLSRPPSGILPISTPSDVHIADDSILRHQSNLPYISTSVPTSSASSIVGMTPLSALSSARMFLPDDTVVTTATQHTLMRRRLFSAFFAYFLCGWGDGITGAILPSFEADFHLNYMTSSLLFATSTVGFAVGTLIIERLMKRLGRFYISSTDRSIFPAVPLVSRLFRFTSSAGKYRPTGYSISQARFLTLIWSSILHAVYFSLMSFKRGYTTILLAYALAAFARACLTSILNAYAASTPKKSLGHLLGFWSVGAFASPFVCQTLMARGIPWPRFYAGSLVVSAVNLCILSYAFRPTRAEFERDRQAALSLASSLTTRDSPVIDIKSDVPSTAEQTTSSIDLVDAPPPKHTLQRAISMPYLWALSIFSWIQSGSETTTQGFMVTYLLVTRNANPKTVGYVTSGFWAGQAMSRFLWGYYTPSLTFTQRKHIIQVCIAVTIVMHLLIWFVNSNVENAFSTGIIGFFTGPLFPGTLRMANDVLPTDVHLVSMAILSAFASFGSAIFPFITGTISNIKGPHILTYVTVAQAAALFCLWGLFPSKVPSRAQDY